MPEMTLRPNGKVYRPRKGLQASVCSSMDEGEGIIVRGTLDVDKAREIARKIWGHTENDDTVDDAPTLTGWFRLVPWDAGFGFDSTWMVDEAHGSPCVVFGAWAR
ncbi:MAG: hypothetical protein ACOH10_15355 [Rhodoglobus sp.]